MPNRPGPTRTGCAYVSDVEHIGEGNYPVGSAFGVGTMGTGQAVTLVNAGDATADGGRADAEVSGDAAQGPVAVKAQAEELMIGLGECQVDHKCIPLQYRTFFAFFRLSG